MAGFAPAPVEPADGLRYPGMVRFACAVASPRARPTRGSEEPVPAKSVQERQQEERERKLADMQEQIKQGTLVVRQMTDEERRANPPRPRTAPPRRRGARG